jgi:hypothetical protein
LPYRALKDELRAAVGEMIVGLTKLRDSERDKGLRRDYRAALDRWDALADGRENDAAINLDRLGSMRPSGTRADQHLGKDRSRLSMSGSWLEAVVPCPFDTR